MTRRVERLLGVAAVRLRQSSDPNPERARAENDTST